MTDASDARERLVAEALNAHKEEYKELSEVWRSLDAKAQGTVAISGLFLAGMLAFVRELANPVASVEKYLLTATTGLLTLSVALALMVLWVRAVRSAPLGSSLDNLINDLLKAKDGTTADRLLNYYRDHADLWGATNIDIDDVNKRKARFLLFSQLSLAFAILCGVIVTFMRIWR